MSRCARPTCPPSRRPPPGGAVRPLRADDEADLRSFHRIYDTAFRDTPDYEPLDFEPWRDRLPSSRQVWDEWFLAEVDGEPAGALQSSDQALDQDEGWVRTCRCCPRTGAGGWVRRCCAAPSRSTRRRAGATAGLGVDLTNPTAPVTLYRSVGLARSSGPTCTSGVCPPRGV